ncbi:MAG: transposase [Verrucomicrobiaceae bacterium]|nr:transposase [Verrucomicrobiaceae bacterium]
MLATEVCAAFSASRSTYGSPRLMHALRAKGLRHGNNRIARLIQLAGFCTGADQTGQFRQRRPKPCP